MDETSPKTVQTSLSPEAVESLARSLAIKMGVDRTTLTTLSNQMTEFHANDKNFKEADRIFKEGVHDTLKTLQKQRVVLPVASIVIALVSIVMSLIALAGSAQAVSKLSDQIERQQHEILQFHPESK